VVGDEVGKIKELAGLTVVQRRRAAAWVREAGVAEADADASAIFPRPPQMVPPQQPGFVFVQWRQRHMVAAKSRFRGGRTVVLASPKSGNEPYYGLINI
jgi:hypothetical protein